MKILFCLPGPSFSGKFLSCWTDLIHACISTGITPLLSQRYSCNIYYVRTNCLGADVKRGEDQKPFNGEIDYDYIMWIDSDIIFKTKDFFSLLKNGKDICSGLYLMEGGKQYACVENWDEEFYKKNGHFQFLEPKDLINKKNLFPVNYVGMGWMLVKRGVFESIKYPWFEPIRKKIGNYVDFTMEDVAFCHKAIDVGFDIMIDPSVKVGHEKKIIL
tara:strand:- start:279 stop:926 length:648 start_codon:yes stop_codon:yes gene_type:complete